MQGASPLASPGLNPGGTGKGANHAPGGGRTFFVACLPCLLLSFLPPFPEGEGYPSTPSPVGKGDQVSFMQGLRPCIPGLNPRDTGKEGEPRTRRGLAPGVAG